MLISKKKFFKRKNRKAIYEVYEELVSLYNSVARSYYDNLKVIRKYKDQFKDTGHIYELICMVEEDVTWPSNINTCHKGLVVDDINYIANVEYVYRYTPNYIDRLSYNIGKMSSLISILEYFDSNDLGVRSK